MTNLFNGLICHVSQTTERDIVLKLSALEIYNETVVDLLNRESGSLRLLDDPEVFIRDFLVMRKIQTALFTSPY